MQQEHATKNAVATRAYLYPDNNATAAHYNNNKTPAKCTGTCNNEINTTTKYDNNKMQQYQNATIQVITKCNNKTCNNKIRQQQ